MDIFSHNPSRADFKKVPYRAFVTAMVGALVFVTLLAFVTLSMRTRLRSQIMSREAAVLSSVTLYELERLDSEMSRYYGATQNVSDSDLMGALLDVSRLNGVVAFRVFDSKGHFLDAAPSEFLKGEISDDDAGTVSSGTPVSRFHPKALLEDFFVQTEALAKDGYGEKRLPLLEILVPIKRSGDEQLDGIGQFLLDGAPTVAAFDSLDRELALQAGLVILASSILGGGLLVWAFWRLNRGYGLLLIRTRELAKANRELALRSRVSAIGAVTANLLHGLKNPLTALSMYVEERRCNGGAEEGLDDAKEATRRMGQMIEESVAILAQEDGMEKFDYTLGEITDVVYARCCRQAKESQIEISISEIPDRSIDNRMGNLFALAVVNLVQNAVQASSGGAKVKLVWSLEESGKSGGQNEDNEEFAILKVEDFAGGLPERMLEDPFKPGKSFKKGGSGVGLAIAYQLVAQMGGELALERSDPAGTVFALRIPLMRS